MPSLGACCSAASNGDWGPPCEQNRAAPGAENVPFAAPTADMGQTPQIVPEGLSALKNQQFMVGCAKNCSFCHTNLSSITPLLSASHREAGKRVFVTPIFKPFCLLCDEHRSHDYGYTDIRISDTSNCDRREIRGGMLCRLLKRRAWSVADPCGGLLVASSRVGSASIPDSCKRGGMHSPTM